MILIHYQKAERNGLWKEEVIKLDDSELNKIKKLIFDWIGQQKFDCAQHHESYRYAEYELCPTCGIRL